MVFDIVILNESGICIGVIVVVDGRVVIFFFSGMSVVVIFSSIMVFSFGIWIKIGNSYISGGCIINVVF